MKNNFQTIIIISLLGFLFNTGNAQENQKLAQSGPQWLKQ